MHQKEICLEKCAKGCIMKSQRSDFMSKVVCIGECLVDMMPSKNGGYFPNAGGAPCNVCACVARLGSAAAYLGKLGGDSYATFCMIKSNPQG